MGKEYKVQVRVKGVAPLLMNKFTAAPQGSMVRKKKTYDPKEEAEKKAYRTEKGKLFLPATHFKACMVKIATEFTAKGKKTYKDYIKAGTIVEPEEIILDQQEYIIHEEPVVINRSRVMSWRPKFKEWSCDFIIQVIDEDYVGFEQLKEILESAGKFKGVGDHRPEFGRFIVEKFKKVK